jgi:hypothetical protein
MRASILALCVMSGSWGCGFSAAASQPGSDAASPDAALPDAGLPIDAAVAADAPVALCAGTLARVCVDPPPSSSKNLTMTTIDTAMASMCTPYTSPTGTTACVIAGLSITVSSSIRVIGDRPLILLAADAITIDGKLDVASHRAAGGAGASLGPCATDSVNPTTTVGGGGGGGWGGSFGGPGGPGGIGVGNGKGGVPPGTTVPATLRGGCPGGGGAGDGGTAGLGGGAVALIAINTVSIAGTVNASGSPGGGGSASGGGGGGGAGGMIVLEAATVKVTGQCFANGGGGGEGANAAADGDPGEASPAPDRPGAGGQGGTMFGGDGGDSAFGKTLGGVVGGVGESIGAAIGGGGGGGGSAGVIKVIAATQVGTAEIAKVAPPPS